MGKLVSLLLIVAACLLDAPRGARAAVMLEVPLEQMAREAGLSASDCDRLIPLARRASSMRGNPVDLSDAELRAILEAAL